MCVCARACAYVRARACACVHMCVCAWFANNENVVLTSCYEVVAYTADFPSVMLAHLRSLVI